VCVAPNRSRDELLSACLPSEWAAAGLPALASKVADARARLRTLQAPDNIVTRQVSSMMTMIMMTIMIMIMIMIMMLTMMIPISPDAVD
jgi:hypothetical protein